MASKNKMKTQGQQGSSSGKNGVNDVEDRRRPASITSVRSRADTLRDAMKRILPRKPSSSSAQKRTYNTVNSNNNASTRQKFSSRKTNETNLTTNPALPGNLQQVIRLPKRKNHKKPSAGRINEPEINTNKINNQKKGSRPNINADSISKPHITNTKANVAPEQSLDFFQKQNAVNSSQRVTNSKRKQSKKVKHPPHISAFRIEHSPAQEEMEAPNPEIDKRRARKKKAPSEVDSDLLVFLPGYVRYDGQGKPRYHLNDSSFLKKPDNRTSNFTGFTPVTLSYFRNSGTMDDELLEEMQFLTQSGRFRNTPKLHVSSPTAEADVGKSEDDNYNNEMKELKKKTKNSIKKLTIEELNKESSRVVGLFAHGDMVPDAYRLQSQSFGDDDSDRSLAATPAVQDENDKKDKMLTTRAGDFRTRKPVRGSDSNADHDTGESIILDVQPHAKFEYVSETAIRRERTGANLNAPDRKPMPPFSSFAGSSIHAELRLRASPNNYQDNNEDIDNYSDLGGDPDDIEEEEDEQELKGIMGDDVDEESEFDPQRIVGNSTPVSAPPSPMLPAAPLPRGRTALQGGSPRARLQRSTLRQKLEETEDQEEEIRERKQLVRSEHTDLGDQEPESEGEEARRLGTQFSFGYIPNSKRLSELKE